MKIFESFGFFCRVQILVLFEEDLNMFFSADAFGYAYTDVKKRKGLVNLKATVSTWRVHLISFACGTIILVVFLLSILVVFLLSILTKCQLNHCAVLN